MDQYKIQKRLGAGKQGTVFLATDKNGNIFALKQVQCSTDAELVKAKEEIALVQTLEHRNMIKYYECFETVQFDNFTHVDQKYIWIVMEYCNGTLDGFMYQRKQPIHEKVLDSFVLIPRQ
jgi:serine/threonine protein kinase